MIIQKYVFSRIRENYFNLTKLTALIAVLLLSNSIYSQSPPAPAPSGKKWEAVDDLSDEFDSFDGSKWFKPLWNYPEPNFMVNENSGVSGGNLWIKATRGSGDQWFISSRVQSRAQIKFPMYTECRMRASSISALNTFWMNNGDANNRDEIDICENNAAPTGSPSNGAETPFINASNWWYAENGTNYDGNSRGQTANNHNSTKKLSPSNPLRGGKLDAAYHIIGCYWIDEKSFEWWLDGEKVGETTLNIPQVFTRNQNIIWDLWTNPHDGFPAKSDLLNNSINTMYVDWIHTYKLVNDAGTNIINLSDLAVGKQAFQSSTFENNISSFGPEKVIDGDNDTFNATENEQGAWWEVDLGDLFTINQIKIWNRGDCCAERLKDFDIKVYDSRGGNIVENIYVRDEPSASGSTYNMNATGRVVRVQLRGTDILNIDQISVFGIANTTLSIPGIRNTNDNFGEKVYIYPIPAQSSVTIKGISDGQKEVLVFNMSGNLMIKTKLTIKDGEAVIDVSSLSSGIYILSVNGKTTSLVIY